jgi:hypothetical protein
MGNNNSKLLKTIPAIVLIIAMTISSRADLLAQENKPAPEAPGDVTVEPLDTAVDTGKWRIINPQGQHVGYLKRNEGGKFDIYDPTGAYMGTVYPSGEFRPRHAGKRTTIIRPHEVRLYLNALDAIEATR